MKGLGCSKYRQSHVGIDTGNIVMYCDAVVTNMTLIQICYVTIGVLASLGDRKFESSLTTIILRFGTLIIAILGKQSLAFPLLGPLMTFRSFL